MKHIVFFRRTLWHLRQGGYKQMRVFLQRSDASGTRSPVSALGWWRKDTEMFPPWEPQNSTPRRNLHVGTVLDEFSAMAFAPEWKQLPLTPGGWKDQLSNQPIDLLFVESAWHGNGDKWRYGISNPPWNALKELVAHCKKNSIPTVFWNKEDPAHYDDFLPTAKLFDVVFTTDINCVPKYEKDLSGASHIGVLPFAAQPLIHNPCGSAKERKDVAFAGMYFAHKYDQRRTQMEIMLGGAAAAAPKLRNGFDIFARPMGDNPNYRYPQQYQPFIRGGLTYSQILTAYRSYCAFLNVNSVVASPSMCARRIFEISACATPVLSAPSPAIDEFYPQGLITQTDSVQETRNWVLALCRSPQLRDKMGYNAMMHTLENHTYSHRVAAILTAAKIRHEEDLRPAVTVLLATNRPQNLHKALANIARQRGVNPTVFLMAQGFIPDPDTLKEFCALKIVPLEVSTEATLGHCYNLGLEKVTDPYVAKMDDDDHYGEYYLLEQIWALRYSGAAVVGKQSHYFHLTGPKLLVLHFPAHEHRNTHFVAGPTIVALTEKAREARFPNVSRGEDTGFLQRIMDLGGTIYSTSRFGFLRHRGTDTEHTWSIDEAHILANSEVIGPDTLNKIED